MRKKELQTSQAAAYQIVDACEYATIAMCGEDGAPYCVPISPVRIGQALYFHGARRGKKASLLQQPVRVCISCVSYAQRVEKKFTESFDSAILFGEAVPVEDAEEKRQALLALCQRYAPSRMKAAGRAVERGLNAAAVWRVQIQEITGKQKRFDEAGKPILPEQAAE